ncbi:DUF6478 family protein [Pseudothioclava nitratireducens]|uniref:DUF6478 family protein n=1 Tax=Pseudothioclava nitratireducens TaxID=1928646 RepID=UPI0023DB3E14|nr:DUF6478 family protein [Defluviimonas nitratireducens]MDF1619808.1 DUF6478 family protein [Defluviimonas nitratireducens]
MSKSELSFLDRFAQGRALRRWSQAARMARALDLGTLRKLRSEARKLRHELDRVLHEAEGRLALPMEGNDAITAPPRSDWTWRPDLWRGPVFPQGFAAAESRTRMGHDITLFHDCKHSELTLRQIRNTREADVAPYGLRMDVFRFDGSFLSLVLDLPDQGVRGLKLNHLVRLDMIVELERPLEIFCRLNVKHGPNTEQVVRELPLGGGESFVEFDLAYTKLNEKRVEKAWVDLIFEGPQMNQIVLRDLTMSRHPRAEI